MADRVLYGLKNVHIASVTTADDGNGNITVTFGTPAAVPGAVNITVEQNGEQATFYADDTLYWTSFSNNGYTGTLEMAIIPDDFYTAYLGMRVDDNGNITETSGDKDAYFALQFEFEGDEKGRRFTYYYVKASRPNNESSTTEDTIEPLTQTLEFSAIPLPDGSGVIKSASGQASTNYDTWFDAIAVPTFPSE